MQEIPKGQFYQALADSMSARLLPEYEKGLCKSVEALDPSCYVADMHREFGEADVSQLCI